MVANPSDAISSPSDAPGTIHVDAKRLTLLVRDVFEAHGLSREHARLAAEALVLADLRGVWSHGVARVPMYCKRIENGVANPDPDITIERVAPAASLVDGDDGLGLVVAHDAMAEAIIRAQEGGVGMVGVKRSGHFGMAAVYAKQASDAGCLGWVFTNSSPALPPFGALSAHLGTSPLAFTAPTPNDDEPFLIDMAMTVVARGKLKFAAQRGELIPEGLALDRDGRPTTDGEAAFDGVVLPFGGVKGSALAWMMDVAAGTFTGAAHAGQMANPFKGLDRPQDTGHLFIAARADLFVPMEEFLGRMGESIASAKALSRAEGFSEILTPGEKEERAQAQLKQDGVPLPPPVVDGLRSCARQVGLEPAI